MPIQSVDATANVSDAAIHRKIVDSTGKATSKNVVLFSYLVIGAIGTTTLVAMEIGIADFLFIFLPLFLIAALVFAYFAWIPAVVLIIVYRGSWLIIIPAATAIASSIAFFVANYSAPNADSGELPNAPVAAFVWVAAFFPVSFVCGLVWIVRRALRSGT